MERLLEEAELDEAQEEKVEREFAREYHLITREDRLDAVAEDLVRHFPERGFRGKAMVVSVDKATAVRMYDKVGAHWKRRIEGLRAERFALPKEDFEAVAEIDERIAWMEETDMAVVVSPAQNEIAEMKGKGLDVRRHRRRMVEEDLETKFKDADDPLRLVFVCAMWMTGFDVPSCSTLYLDKPMRNHTLMQTIARANRVYPRKEAGLIVDYVGVFRHLERALAIYGAGGGGDASPAEDKAALLAGVGERLKQAEAVCREQGVELGSIEGLEGFRRLELLADAVDALVATVEIKRRFLGLAKDAERWFRAALPDVRAQEFRPRVRLLSALAGRIRALDPPADVSLTMKQVEALLDESVEAEGYVIGESGRYSTDLSAIDFEKLAAKFERSRKRTFKDAQGGQADARLAQASPGPSGRSADDRAAPGRRTPESLHAGTVSAEGERAVPARLRELLRRRRERLRGRIGSHPRFGANVRRSGADPRGDEPSRAA